MSKQATFTETFDGNEQQDLFLRHIPIASITSVVEDGNTLVSGNEKDYVHYDNGRLRRIVVRWSGIKPKNIVVTYVGGYQAADIPAVIKQTSAKAAARMLMTSLQIASKADTGQVGINSAAPNFDLDIRGGGSRDGVSVGTTVFIYSQSHATTTSNKAELRFGYNHSGNNYAHGYIFLEEQGGNAFDGRMSFGVPYNNGGGGSSTRHVLQLQGSTGNVGIGTTIPVASSSAYNSAALHIHQTSNSSAGSQIHLTNGATGGAAGNGSHISMYTDDDLYIVNQESDGRIKFGSGGVSDCLTIDDSGNTIIQGNLTVQGTEGNSGIIQIYSDQGDDNEDKYRFLKSSGNHNLVLQNYTGGSWTTNATFGNDESVVFAGQVDGTTFVDSKGSLRSIPQLTKNSQHALVASDAGQCCFSSSGGFVINDSVMSSGDAVTLINNSGSSMTITQGSGVTLYNTADATTGNKTLTTRGIATVWFSSASVGYISGNF